LSRFVYPMTEFVEGSRLPIAAVERIAPEMHGGADYTYLTLLRATQRYVERKNHALLCYL
jgi:hypothetical protein